MFKSTALIGMIDDYFSCIGVDDAYSKLAGYLSLQDIFTVDSVYVCGMRCASKARYRSDTMRFLGSPWSESYRICDAVLSGDFVPKYRRKVEINERGKRRVILPPYFDNKVVQKVLVDYIVRPVLMSHMLDTSYAGVPGKGCSLMFKNVLRDLNSAVSDESDFKVVITDYSKFFDTIPTGMLLDSMGEYVLSEDVIDEIRLFFPNAYGASLGNEMSQIPASFYPTPVDKAVVSKFGVRYHRYMDDTIAIVPSEYVPGYVSLFKSESAKLGLMIPERKIRIYDMRTCFSFCKEQFRWDRRHKRYYALPNMRRFKREKQKIVAMSKKVESGDISYSVAESQFYSVIGSLRKDDNTFRACAELQRFFDDAFDGLC